MTSDVMDIENITRHRGYTRIEPLTGGRSESETRGRIGTNANRVPAKDDYRRRPSQKSGRWYHPVKNKTKAELKLLVGDEVYDPGYNLWKLTKVGDSGK